MMKTLVIVAATLLLVGVAGAQVHYEFHCTGSGNMVMNSPVIYSGNIDSGDLAPGSWVITVPDGPPWPGPGPARWTYIWSTYYVYDPGFQIWTGTFDNNHLYLEKTGVGAGSMQGTCDMTFQIIDMNGNSVLDPEECMDGLSGAVIIIEDGTGAYAHLCGDGTYEGFYFRDCDDQSPTYMLDNVDFNMYLDLEDCGMATDASTWGAVKALFR
jgi:hypothetical protein